VSEGNDVTLFGSNTSLFAFLLNEMSQSSKKNSQSKQTTTVMPTLDFAEETEEKKRESRTVEVNNTNFIILEDNSGLSTNKSEIRKKEGNQKKYFCKIVSQ
jgi:hypothetical protein